MSILIVEFLLTRELCRITHADKPPLAQHTHSFFLRPTSPYWLHLWCLWSSSEDLLCMWWLWSWRVRSVCFEQRVLHHGHKEHTLTLMKLEACFKCDACYNEAKDSFAMFAEPVNFDSQELCFLPLRYSNYYLSPLPSHLSFTLFLTFIGILTESATSVLDYKSSWLYYLPKMHIFCAHEMFYIHSIKLSMEWVS